MYRLDQLDCRVPPPSPVFGVGGKMSVWVFVITSREAERDLHLLRVPHPRPFLAWVELLAPQVRAFRWR